MGTLNFFINSLPNEIIEIITKLTYKPQPYELCNDIISFISDTQYIKEKYYEHYILMLEDEKNEDLYWVINDITRYYNEDVPTMRGYTSHFYDIIRKHYKYSDITKFVNGDQIFEDLSKKTPHTQINILLALLLPDQRGEFIKKYIP